MLEGGMQFLGPGGRTRKWLRDRRANWLVAVSRSVGGDIAANYLANQPALSGYLEQFSTGVPQGRIVDESVAVCDHRDWRTHFASRLQGRGLELGPLHRPMVTHPGMEMTYVDRADQETLKREYPAVALDIVPVGVIDDAETLATVADGSYDFLIASHVIEHMRNPIGAVVNWLRVLREGGLVYLVVPDKRRTFDKLRVRTTLAHMVLDYQQPSDERDFEHFLDYAVFVHHAMIDQAIDEARRLRDTDVSIHYHVFLPQDVVRLAEWIDGHVTPVAIAEGPALSPASDEFHLLLRKGAPR
jgi:predicted SAM-dependent methyltransferase